MKKNIKKIKLKEVSDNALTLKQMRDIIASSDEIIAKLRALAITTGTNDFNFEMRISTMELFVINVLTHYVNNKINDVHSEIREELVNEVTRNISNNEGVKKIIKKYGTTNGQNKSAGKK